MHSTALSKHHQLPPQPFHSHSHSQACPFRRLAPLSSARTAASSNADSAATFLSLPLFPLPSALHPAQSGTLLVFEPRYLELFRPLQAQLSTPDAGGSEPKFGHILAASAAPPALMSSAVGGLPPLGVCATVKSIGELSNGRLQVTYQGTRRFKLLTVDNQSQPYPVGAATWYDDDAPAGPTQQQLIDQLELDVYRMLKQVASYSQQLTAAAAAASTSSDSDTDEQQQPSSSSGANASTAAAQQQYLPPSVLMYAPPPPGKQSVAEYLIRSGHPAGGQIATWQRLGSVYSGDATNKQKPSQDPYQLARENVGKERRQELFSFAAASVLELGLPERLALLQCQDTAARLQFVAAAVQPHLADLVARVSLQQALVKP